jgi:hypothetical protein
MFANLTPLLDSDQLVESFQLLRTLRQDYGFTIRHAMNCDVNGENWPLVDLLLDLGITGFTMAINSHFGGPFRPRPYPFLWEGPSGRRLPVFNGWPYDKGWSVGIGRDADNLETTQWPRLRDYLESIDYPLPILLLQSFHPYGDNGSAFDFTPFIDAWNAAGKSPRIVLATPHMWWSAVDQYRDRLKAFRGDWTDYWNFGSISSAREQTTNRGSRVRLRAADALYALLNALPPANEVRQWSQRAFRLYRDPAWQALNLWDEHTWGADIAIRAPGSEDTASQWYHKASYAYTARSLSLMLQRDALADFAHYVPRQRDDDLLVFNPLPWERTISGGVPLFVTAPRGKASDTTAGRQHQDREDWNTHVLPPTTVPGLGYAVVSRDQLVDVSAPPTAHGNVTVENHRYRVTFDRDKGGITSLFDKQLDWEWVDTTAGYPLNGYVHEMVAETAAAWPRAFLFIQDWSAPLADIPAGWQTDWQAKRSMPSAVVAHHVFQTPLGTKIVQELAAPGCESRLVQQVFLPHFADWIECESAWDLGLDIHPQAQYILFPFNLPGATPRFDLGGQPVIPGQEQLPGVCRDYFTAQGWVDFAMTDRGVTVALPDNPMVQLGDFHFGHFQQTFSLERALLLGWVTNNYWETNFRAHQPGRVTARYRLLPYGGGFDEARAHRFSQEAANAAPLVQHLGEPSVQPTPLPAGGSLLRLPDAPVLTLHVKRASSQPGLIVRLLNASDAMRTAQIQSGLLKILEGHVCDLLETPYKSLPVTQDRVTVELEPRRMAVVHLKTSI